MSVIASINLRCTVGTSDKVYLIEMHDDRKVVARYGRFGSNLSGRNELGLYFWEDLETILKQKIAKGYEIVEVNERPFYSGDIDDAIRLFESGDWNAVKTAQPTPVMKLRDVSVTFDPGQIAPIW